MTLKEAPAISGQELQPVTKVASAFRSMGKTSVNRVGNCGRQRTFDERDAHALVRYVRKNRRATFR